MYAYRYKYIIHVHVSTCFNIFYTASILIIIYRQNAFIYIKKWWLITEQWGSVLANDFREECWEWYWGTWSIQERWAFITQKAILLMASDGHSTGYIRPLPSPVVLLLEVYIYLHMLYLKYLILYFILIFVYKLHHIDRIHFHAQYS